MLDKPGKPPYTISMKTWLLLVLISPSLLYANMAKPRQSIQQSGAAFVVGQKSDPIKITHEDLAIDCERAKPGIVCQIRAQYHLHNQGESDEKIVGAFVQRHRGLTNIVNEGHSIKGKLSAAETALIRAALGERYHQGKLQFTGFRTTLGAGAKTILQAQSTAKISCWAKRSYLLPAIAMRHLWLYDDKQKCNGFDYPIFPIETWGGQPQINVRVTGHHGLQLKPELTQTKRWQESGLWHTEHRTTIEAPYSPWLRLYPRYRPHILRNGGFRTALGGSPQYGFIGQLGYGYGLGSVFILGADLTSNFDESHSAALVLEFATPMLVVIPSFSLGAGAAYEFGARSSPGLRLQTGLQFGPLGFQTMWDHFPDSKGISDWRKLFVAVVSF